MTLRGRVVVRRVESTPLAGTHTVTWAPRPELTAGVHLVRLEADGELRVRKTRLDR